MSSVVEKRKQKRTALPGPKAKKARIDTSSKEKEEKGKKRSRPVTAPAHEESGVSEEEFDDEGAWGDESETGVDEGNEEDSEGAQGKAKDPNGAYTRSFSARSMLRI